jgi:uncharacterized protein YkwD
LLVSIAPSPRRLCAIATAAAAALFLLTGALGSALAQARPATVNATVARRESTRRVLRCRLIRREGRKCGHSARLVRESRRRHGAAAKRSGQREAEIRAAGQAAARTRGSASTPGANGEPCANTELPPSSANLAQVREATLCLINEQREQHGELPLTESNGLLAAAQGHSEDMVARNYFEHTTPSGEEFQTRIIASGYVPRGAAYELGENIDIATLSLSTPAATVNAWMNSPEHRANILNGEFRDSGIGIAAAVPAYFAQGQGGATYTQDFGVLAS